jgi:hypothetical protein
MRNIKREKQKEIENKTILEYISSMTPKKNHKKAKQNSVKKRKTSN